MAFQTPLTVVVVAAAIVLLFLPAMFIFLAYHTHKEHIRWREEHGMAVKSIEEEAQRNRETQASSPGNNDNDNSSDESENDNDNNRHSMQGANDSRPPT